MCGCGTAVPLLGGVPGELLLFVLLLTLVAAMLGVGVAAAAAADDGVALMGGELSPSL